MCAPCFTFVLAYVFLFSVKYRLSFSPFCLEEIGTLRSNDATATKPSLESEFAFFQSLSQLFLPTYFIKCRRPLVELNFEGPYPSSEGNKISSLLVYVLHKTWNWHFHVVVVQKGAKKCTKKSDARSKLLFWLWNLLFFWRSRRRPRRWILKFLMKNY